MTAIEQDALFIGGAWTAPRGGGRIAVVSPSSEQQVGSVAEAGPADADAAVSAARAAFAARGGWAGWEPARRADALDAFADAYERRAGEFAHRVSLQNGMPIAIASRIEAGIPVAVYRYYAALARALPAVERRDGVLGGAIDVLRHPVGVVAAIVPWNFPQTLTAFKLAPALAAGCAIVLKPSPETVLDALLLADCAREAGLPDGVLNIVPGGRELGARLVAHPGVDKVAFTGSTAAGRSIAEVCGRLLRPVTLELGGKSAAIVLDDAELKGAVEQLFGATLLNNGQTCFLSTRVLAPRARYDEVVELLAALARGLTVGDALDPLTEVGPLATSAQRERVRGCVERGRADGARLVAGGGVPAGRERGWFVEPTVFADVRNDDALAREEIFGPVLAVIPYDGEDEAVALANDSPYGLGGTVWTRDLERGAAVAARMQTGTVGLNAFLLDPAAPFGGVKASGLGRELGPEGLAAYQHVQSIHGVSETTSAAAGTASV